ncbi:metallophosphatase [Rhizobium rhizosphaerae]|uniref:Metallophosphatase n=1 Tax=Xaviernesmea rhizosphaerae TaxID=1672749 RepID=A0A1Q9AEC4_9HYPH|nr:ligase-associated DNA damage response endonuclease PdeM [Xaviernesmea rhizosphaerae]OLP53241.1 metallophosphatase [Xaviernesmea rhizosphaerae]
MPFSSAGPAPQAPGLNGPVPLFERILIQGVEALCDPSGALFLPAQAMLIVSDLHLERGAAFARRGSLLPPYDTLAQLARLEQVIARHDPKHVLSLGDTFHDRRGAAMMPTHFREQLDGMMRGREFIFILGNHDPDGVADLPGVVASVLHLDGLTFRHEPSAGQAPGEIAGHLHPSASVTRRGGTVRRPCFASDGQRLIMPAFGTLAGGLDLDHKTMRGLFDRRRLTAHLLGRDRVYSVRYDSLAG